MAEPLIEELALDISPALDALTPLGDALTALATDFATSIADALASLSDLQAAPVDVAVTADTSELDSGIADAFDAPRPPVDVEGDASSLTDAIDSATAVSPTVSIDADTTEAQTKIDGLTSQDVTVSVDADTSDAQDQIDSLGDSATQATGSGGGGGGGGSGLAGLEGAVVGVKAASGAAVGETGELTGAIGGLSSGLGAGVAAGAAFAAFLGETTKLSADAQAQQAQFNRVFGESKEALDNIRVGGLSTSIEELGKQTGTANADLEASASRIGLIGTAAGATQPEVAKTAGNVLGLAAALSVTNPRLGDTATAADTISKALIGGRTKALIPYGISLTQNQIVQEALNETQKTSADQLTGYDKLVAGLTLALQQQGDTLGTKYAAGIQNAQVQLRALKVEIEESLVAIGQPLLAPITQSLQELLPVAVEVGQVLGALASDVLPLVAVAAEGLRPLAALLGLAADGLRELGPAGFLVAGSLALIIPELIPIATGFSAAAIAAGAFGTALDIATGPIGITVGLLAALGFAVREAGQTQHEAAIDTSAIDNAFQTAGTSAGTYTSVLDGLTSAVDKYLQKQLAVEAHGKTGTEAANDLGLSYGQLRTAITGTSETFGKVEDQILGAAIAAKDADGPFNDLADSVGAARIELQKNAQQALEGAVASGTVTKAQLASAEAHRRNSQEVADDTGETVDYVSALKDLSPTINANNAAQAAATRATADQSGAFATLTQQIATGAVGVADAAQVATTLGISTNDATTFITEQTAALAQQHDQQILTSAAGQKITDQLQAGTITVQQATVAYAQLGVSIPGVTSAITAADSAVSSFVNDALQQLPTVADAFKKATANSKVNLDTFGTDLQKEIVSIAQFTDNLTTLVGEGFGNLAQFLASQGPQVAGQAAAALASDSSKAKVLDATIGLFGGAEFESAVKLRKLFPGLSETAIQQATGAFGAAGTQAAGSFQDGVAKGLSQTSARGRSEGSDRSAGLFGASAAGAADGAKAAGATAGAAAQTAFDGSFHPAASATQKLALTSGAIQQGGAAAAATAGQAGTSITQAFAHGLLFDSTIEGALLRLPAAFINGAGAVESVATATGQGLGGDFTAGFAAGISATTFQVEAAAAAAGAKALAAAKKAIDAHSPSRETEKIGVDFATGFAAGIIDGGETATAAASGLSASAAEALKQSLTDALASAGTATTATVTPAQQAIQSLVSTASSALPSVGGEISNFAQTIVSTMAAQDSAFKAYRKALGDQKDDQAAVQKLQQQTAISYGVLAQALVHYNDVAAATPKKATDAQKAALAAAKSELSDAQSAYDHFANSLDSAGSKLTTATKNLHGVEEAFKKATAAQDRASNPETFIRSLNQSTAASAAFEKEIAKLNKEGFTGLAEALAKEGPDAAGALAAAFASAPAKAKSAEAAIDHANAFATAYQTEIQQLFGAGGAAAAVAATAGTSAGTALVTGMRTVLQEQVPTIVGSLTPTAAAGRPAIDLTPTPRIASLTKAVQPVAPAAPVFTPLVLSGSPVAGQQGGIQTLALDLTVVLEDGSTVTTAVDVPIPPSGASLTQRVRAEVHA